MQSVFGEETEIVGFSDPFEGVEHLKEKKSDILLLDIMMQPIDGWEVLEMLQASNSLPEHIYILSSSLRVEDIEYASKLSHVDSFIKKPLNKDRLERIQFALR